MSATVEKALRVLELLSTYSTPVRLAELSRELDMNKSTTYRMLEKMGQLGYVRQDEMNGRYMLSTRMWEIGVRAFQRFDIRTWGRPYLQRIEQEVHETAVLAILDRHDVVIVEKHDSSQAVQTFSPLGSRTPLHCSSLGKAFLMTEADLGGSLKKPLQSFTEHTITSIRDLRKEIDDARQEGVATAFNEFSIGVSGVSAPILGVDAKALAVIGVTLPSIRAEGAHLERAKRVVREQATEFSRSMGYFEKEPG
ncbi:MAG: IclR family transcriptional regulator [Rhizobiales bacterium]|nr:IclR family transcriptional regulator [Hyphomicrobiales bacterium]